MKLLKMFKTEIGTKYYVCWSQSTIPFEQCETIRKVRAEIAILIQNFILE